MFDMNSPLVRFGMWLTIVALIVLQTGLICGPVALTVATRHSRDRSDSACGRSDRACGRSDRAHGRSDRTCGNNDNANIAQNDQACARALKANNCILDGTNKRR